MARHSCGGRNLAALACHGERSAAQARALPRNLAAHVISSGAQRSREISRGARCRGIPCGCPVWLPSPLGRGDRTSVRGECPPPTTPCDTRLFRGRALPAYAGCMTIAPAAPIDSVYSSHPHPSTRSMAPAAKNVFVGILASLVAGSRPRPCKHPKPRMPEGTGLAFLVLVDRRPRMPETGAVGILGRVPL